MASLPTVNAVEIVSLGQQMFPKEMEILYQRCLIMKMADQLGIEEDTDGDSDLHEDGAGSVGEADEVG